MFLIGCEAGITDGKLKHVAIGIGFTICCGMYRYTEQEKGLEHFRRDLPEAKMLI